MSNEDEHVIEALGKTRVIIRNGIVVEVGEPKIDYCPIFDKYRGIKGTPANINPILKKRILNFV